jgi:protein subunit release factor B
MLSALVLLMLTVPALALTGQCATGWAARPYRLHRLVRYIRWRNPANNHVPDLMHSVKAVSH